MVSSNPRGAELLGGYLTLFLEQSDSTKENNPLKIAFTQLQLLEVND